MFKSAPYLALVAVCLAPVAPARDLAEIRRGGRLEVAGAANDLPLENDLLGGFGRAIEAELRITPFGSAAAALQAVAEGRADVAAGGLVSQLDRREGVTFTAEVFPSRLVAVTRRPSKPIQFLEQLRSLRMLAPPGSGAVEALAAAKLPSSKVDGALPADKALASLRGSPDAAVVIGLFGALVARRSDPALEVGTALGARQSVAFAVRQADATLLSALNGHLGQLRASPSWRLIIVRNLGEDSLQILARSRLDDSP